MVQRTDLRQFGRLLLGLSYCIVASAVGAQQAIEYRYGDPASGTTGSPAQSDIIRRGANQAFRGLPSEGTVGGSIGVSIPAPELSRLRIESERVRAEDIERKWQQFLSASTDPKKYLDEYNERKQTGDLRAFKATSQPEALKNWASSDGAFKILAAKAVYDIRSSSAITEPRKQIADVGLRAIDLADAASANGLSDEASFYYSIGRGAADILVGIDPITGTLRALYESITGENLVTGQKLSDVERGLAVFTAVTVGFGGPAAKGISIFGKTIVGGVGGARAIASALSHAKWIAQKFSSFRGKRSIEKTSARFIGMLREATSGPTIRAQKLMAKHESVLTGILRSHPELYRLDDLTIELMNLGKATESEAHALGLAFVGEKAVQTTYRGQKGAEKIFISADKRRIYRPAAPKTRSGGKRQANLEVHAPPGRIDNKPLRRKALSNAHIDVE